MAKSDQQNTRSAANQFGSQAQGTANQNIMGGGAFGANGLSGQYSQATGNAANTFNSAYGGFQSAQGVGGFDPNGLNTLRSNEAGVASGGGYDSGAVGSLRSNYAAALPTGGFDATQLGGLRTAGQGLMATGGYDPTQEASITSGYQSLADNGGFTPQQSQDYRNRATESVADTYQVLQDQYQRSRAATGGLGTGGDSARMARQLSEESAKANLNAEASLADQTRAGKLAGLGGLQTNAAGVAAGKTNAFNAVGGLESNVASGAQNIMGQQSNLEGNIASGVRAGVGLQAGTEGAVAGGNLAADSGLSQLYNTATGAVSDLGKQILGQMGLASTDQQTQLSVLTQLANTPGVFDNILRAGQVAGGVLTGIGGAAKGLSGGN